MDPQDIYLQFKNAQKQNKKIVLSTIYGLYTEYERKAERWGLFQKIANFFIVLIKSDILKFWYVIIMKISFIKV